MGKNIGLILLTILCVVACSKKNATNTIRLRTNDSSVVRSNIAKEQITINSANKPSEETGNQTRWDKLRASYQDDDRTNQLLFVRCTEGSNALIEYYMRDSVTHLWMLDSDGSCSGFIGRNGLGKTRQGDMKTPIGTFTARQAFGIKPDPGAKLHYYRVTNTTYGCGDSHFYNQIVDISNPKYRHDCKGEKMWTYVPQYNYGLEITYNNDNVVGKGAAIFVHVKGNYPYTGGCISMDEDKMRHIVMTATDGIKICIYKDSEITS